ncbi:ABC transporter permease [Vibrio sp. ZSDE26]|uniref:ABC transporter permease n=1 Tax=Vibrio amylolyticus TaxID=2847292 RepID=A0A9X2BIS0_9VIBR|nr:ABC transporter permease [Vibrio amylolyticus]MCK6262747.1 ABC transporter permease [Vibrio amylolyticus]
MSVIHKQLQGQFQHQLDIVNQDKWLLSCLTWIPLVLALSIWGIFSAGIARDLPIGVVDLSHSSLSQKLIRQFDASSTLSVDETFTDVYQAKQALIESRVYAYVIIPHDFDKGIMQRSLPQVSTFYNSQYILVGRLISSAVMQTMGYFNASIETLQQLSSGDMTTVAAMGKAVPISTQITALFNRNTNYAQFLVSAIVPALWQVVIVVSTILILSANYRRYSRLSDWLGANPFTTLVNTLKGYVAVFAVQGAMFLAWFYYWLNWPLQGSLIPVLVAQLAMILACISVGCLFFLLTLDATRAMSFAGAFTAPSFAFMGVTFPATDMNVLAQWWRSLLPVSHYIEVQISQVSYALPALDSYRYLIPMLGYLVVVVVCLALIKKRCQQEESL